MISRQIELARHALGVRCADDDPLHKRLRRAIERRVTSYLWVRGDTPPFRPALLGTVYGDGRALFALATINQRPRYWVIRGDSRWSCDLDTKNARGPQFSELSDGILTELEDYFGNGRCGYSGSSLFLPKYERIRNCQCEDCSDGKYRARWPMVDGSDGCSWSRMDWPSGFEVVPNPLSWRGNLLVTKIERLDRAALQPGERLEGDAKNG